MKFVVFALAVLALLWLIKSARRRVPPPVAKSPPPSKVEDMVACAQCGVHLPRGDALPGRGGLFCGESHRRAFEQGHPEA
jgi:uncharacterized protein